MSAITSHILDTSRGRPASGIAVSLEHLQDSGEWTLIGRDQTNDDGRAQQLLSDSHPLTIGRYRLSFELARYFDEMSVESFYPSASIVFEVRDADEHYHVPLLLNPYGYSTYRGS